MYGGGSPDAVDEQRLSAYIKSGGNKRNKLAELRKRRERSAADAPGSLPDAPILAAARQAACSVVAFIKAIA